MLCLFVGHTMGHIRWSVFCRELLHVLLHVVGTGTDAHAHRMARFPQENTFIFAGENESHIPVLGVGLEPGTFQKQTLRHPPGAHVSITEMVCSL